MIRHLIPIFLSLVLGCASAVAEVPSLINYQGKIAVSGVNFNGTGQFKFALVSGGTNLSQTATATATLFNGFVVGGTVTSGGSGYQTAPAITISGNGSGATAKTTISGGAVSAIQILNAGSGYTGPVTFTIAAPTSNVINQTYWSNDGSSAGGSEPSLATSLPVSAGIYSVLLGDTQITNMQAIPAATFKNNDVRLRVWFSDGVNGFQLLTPDQRISAVGYAMMAANVSDGAITSAQLANGAVVSDKIASGAVGTTQIADGAISADKLSIGSVSADKLAAGAASAAMSRDGNILLTTGKRVDLESQGFVAIGILNNMYSLISKANNAPAARVNHTAIWTGSEMIVWGGSSGNGGLNTGARYNPTTDIWKATSVTNAPAARTNHTVVWSGSEMIVWGGYGVSEPLNTSGRYDPTTDTWASTVVTNTAATPARSDHTAVWATNQMILFGGDAKNSVELITPKSFYLYAKP